MTDSFLSFSLDYEIDHSSSVVLLLPLFITFCLMDTPRIKRRQSTQASTATKAQPGIKSQTYKMLELLPTRGPDAFNKFLRIIEPDYEWLARKLRDDLEQEVSKVPKKELTMVATSMSLQQTPNQTNGTSTHRSMKDVEVSVMTSQPSQQPKRSISLTESAPHKDYTDSAIHLNGYHQMKKNIGHFMTQQFSLSRKLCQSDKQAIENFITEQIRDVQKQCNQKITEVHDNRRLNDSIQRWISSTCRKLERQISHLNHCDTADGSHSCHTNGKSIKDVDDCLLHLTEKCHKLESEVKKCHHLLGDSDDSHTLAYQVESLLAERKRLKKELKKAQQENDMMVHENYELSSNCQKYKQEKSYKDVELEVKDKQIKTLQSEKHDLKKEIERLQRLHIQHLEKEKTLLNLQQMVNALKEQNDSLVDETANMRVKMQADDIKKNSPRRSQSLTKNSRPMFQKFKSPTRKKPIRQ